MLRWLEEKSRRPRWLPWTTSVFPPSRMSLQTASDDRRQTTDDRHNDGSFSSTAKQQECDPVNSQPTIASRYSLTHSQHGPPPESRRLAQKQPGNPPVRHAVEDIKTLLQCLDTRQGLEAAVSLAQGDLPTYPQPAKEAGRRAATAARSYRRSQGHSSIHNFNSRRTRAGQSRGSVAKVEGRRAGRGIDCEAATCILAGGGEKANCLKRYAEYYCEIIVINLTFTCLQCIKQI